MVNLEKGITLVDWKYLNHVMRVRRYGQLSKTERINVHSNNGNWQHNDAFLYAYLESSLKCLCCEWQ